MLLLYHSDWLVVRGHTYIKPLTTCVSSVQYNVVLLRLKVRAISGWTLVAALIADQPVCSENALRSEPTQNWWQRWDLRLEVIPEEVVHKQPTTTRREGLNSNQWSTVGRRPNQLRRIRPLTRPRSYSEDRVNSPRGGSTHSSQPYFCSGGASPFVLRQQWSNQTGQGFDLNGTGQIIVSLCSDFFSLCNHYHFTCCTSLVPFVFVTLFFFLFCRSPA